MLKRKNIITIIIAAVCGLIGTVLVLSYVNSVKAAYSNENLSEVVVAARSIPENVRISKDMLQVANVEEEYILPETFANADEIVGMMTNAGIYKGEQIVKGRISHGDTPSSFSYSIPEGKRAISLALDTLKSVSGFIQPRDKIDILLTLPKPDGNNTSTQKIAQKLLEGKRVVTFDGSSLTFTLFQNVEIAAIGNMLTRTSIDNQLPGSNPSLPLNICRSAFEGNYMLLMELQFSCVLNCDYALIVRYK